MERFHIASNNPKNNKPFICSHCAKSFKNQRDLRAHENTIHTKTNAFYRGKKYLNKTQHPFAKILK